MSFAQHLPRTGEGAVALAVLLVTALEFVVLGLAPAGHRLTLSGVLLGAAVVLFAAVATAVHLRRRAAEPHAEPLPTEGVDENWFTPETLDGFPAQAVRSLLHDPGAPGRNSLYVAWICAVHGCDAPWIVHHLGLPEEVAHVLADAAAEHYGAHARATTGRQDRVK
ncbi:hypothetical protein [Streptomyces sp. NPDC002537]